MTVDEAINLLTDGTEYEIKGAYSGKIYHKSYMNSSKNLDKYAKREVLDKPFYIELWAKTPMLQHRGMKPALPSVSVT